MKEDNFDFKVQLEDKLQINNRKRTYLVTDVKNELEIELKTREKIVLVKELINKSNLEIKKKNNLQIKRVKLKKEKQSDRSQIIKLNMNLKESQIIKQNEKIDSFRDELKKEINKIINNNKKNNIRNIISFRNNIIIYLIIMIISFIQIILPNNNLYFIESKFSNITLNINGTGDKYILTRYSNFLSNY